jgi:hypothetical protein
MKIYFAAAIRAGRADTAIYASIIEMLREKWEVLTEFVGSPQLGVEGSCGASGTSMRRICHFCAMQMFSLLKHPLRQQESDLRLPRQFIRANLFAVCTE